MKLTPQFSALVLVALVIIGASMLITAVRRSRRAQRELAYRDETRAEQRRTIQQWVIDTEDECRARALDYRRAMGRGEVRS